MLADNLRGIYYIALKDMKAYYLKPPAISWGVIFPAALLLAFYIRSPGNFEDLVPTSPLGFADGGTPLANIGDTVVANVVCGGGPCTFAPLQPLSGFDGSQSVGAWTICFGDDLDVIPGAVYAFELELTTAP